MENIKEYLIEIKKALIDEEEKKKEINVLKGKIATFEQKKKDLEKAKKECIDKTTKERKAEVEKTYEDLILNTTEKLKSAKEKKEQERKKNKKELIEKETKVKKENNIYLKNELIRILKENRLPRIVNSNFYFSLFKYENIKSVMRGIIITLFFLIFIPLCVVFSLWTYTSYITRIMIFVINLFLFGLIYLFIDKTIKIDKDLLKEIKDLRRDIRDNEKDIKDITNKINKDNDDSKFDFSTVDRDIEQATLDLNLLKEKQKDAEDKFETETKKEIENNIEKAASKDIGEIDSSLDKVKDNLLKEITNYDSLTKNILQKYESTLGKNNLNMNRIDKLIDIINEKDDISLEKAIEILNNKK